MIRFIYCAAITCFCMGQNANVALAAPNVVSSWFTPAVVPETYTGQVRYEAMISESPPTVTFQYGGADRPMFDDGSNGDLMAGDGIWTMQFQANEILDLLTPARVFRPFIGFTKPAGSGSFNTFAEVWTSEVGLAEVHPIDASTQQTDYLINFTATRDQLLNFNAAFWANRFYALHGDKFDFLNFVHVAGRRGNRYHAAAKNDVSGIGTGLFNNTAAFGSAGRLRGYNVFPVPSFFDHGSPGFSHETGHQWINFLHGTPFASGIAHWPKGDVAINVMGFSIPGSGAGGTYSFTFTPNGLGGYLVGPNNPLDKSTFNSMELYLMGLVAPNEVGTFFVLNNQNQNVTVGQTLQPSEITLVNIDDVTGVVGPRQPDSTASQKTFRCATIVLSEELLDVHAMSLYSWFARRAEAKEPVDYASGFLTSTGNPFYVATGGRAVMFSKIEDEKPQLDVTHRSDGKLDLRFPVKIGIEYQLRSSTDLSGWADEGPPIHAPVTDPPGDSTITIVVDPVMSGPIKFYRLALSY